VKELTYRDVEKKFAGKRFQPLVVSDNPNAISYSTFYAAAVDTKIKPTSEVKKLSDPAIIRVWAGTWLSHPYSRHRVCGPEQWKDCAKFLTEKNKPFEPPKPVKWHDSGWVVTDCNSYLRTWVCKGGIVTILVEPLLDETPREYREMATFNGAVHSESRSDKPLKEILAYISPEYVRDTLLAPYDRAYIEAYAKDSLTPYDEGK